MKVNRNELTPELARLYLKYDRDTGYLIWIRCSGVRGKVGSRAGNIVKNRGNRIVQLLGEVYLEHRLIWFIETGKWPVGDIDHIDHNESNNSWKNLREVCRLTNNMNTSFKSNNTTGYIGVHRDSRCPGYIAEIKVGKIRKSKKFKTVQEAAHQRTIWEKELGFHENHGIIKPH